MQRHFTAVIFSSSFPDMKKNGICISYFFQYEKSHYPELNCCGELTETDYAYYSWIYSGYTGSYIWERI